MKQSYEALTLSRDAAEAKVHRSNVYRRWTSKPQLVSDTPAEHLPPIAARGTGTLTEPGATSCSHGPGIADCGVRGHS